MAITKRRLRRIGLTLQTLEDRLAPAALDPNFGTQGKTVVEGFGFDPMADAAQDASERLVVVASTLSPGGVEHSFQVARFTATGVLDPLFGNGGKVTTSGFDTREFTPANAYSDVVTTNQNQIFVAGTANNTQDIAFVHYGESGNVLLQRTIDRGTNANAYRVSDIAIDSSGTPLIAGRISTGSEDQIFVLRLGGGSTIDSWFSFALNSPEDGLLGPEHNPKITVMPNGQIVVGFANLDVNTGKKELFALKLNSDLGFNTSFGSNGFFVDDFGSPDNQIVPRYLLPQGDDILILGDVTVPTGERYPGLWRLHSDGSLDNSFDVDGRALIDQFGQSWWEPGGARSATLTADGKIIVFGGIGHGLVMFRLGSDGILDTTFGPSGTGFQVVSFSFSPPTYYHRAVGIMFQPNRNAFVVAAHVRGFDQNTDRYDFALARFLDGSHVSLTAPSHFASIGENVELTARVFRDGVPTAGQVVHFEGKQGDAVVFTADVTSDAQGFATVTHTMTERAEVDYLASSGESVSERWKIKYVPASERLKITLTTLDGLDDDDKPDVLFPAIFSLFAPEKAYLVATVTYDGMPLANADVKLTITAFTPDEDQIAPAAGRTVPKTDSQGKTVFDYASTYSHTDKFVALVVHAGVASTANYSISWQEPNPTVEVSYLYGFDTVTVIARLYGTINEFEDEDDDGTPYEYRVIPGDGHVVQFSVTDGPSQGAGREHEKQVTNGDGQASFTFPVNVSGIPLNPVDTIAVAPATSLYPTRSIQVRYTPNLGIAPTRTTPTVGETVKLVAYHGKVSLGLQWHNFSVEGVKIRYTIQSGPNAPGGPRTIDAPSGALELTSSDVGTDRVFAEVFDGAGNLRGTTEIAEIEWRSANTPVGDSVEVRPAIDGMVFAPFTISGKVATAGNTTIRVVPANEFRTPFPNGFALASRYVYSVFDKIDFYFEITTTAVFEGPITIKFAFPQQAHRFQLGHYVGDSVPNPTGWSIIADDNTDDGEIILEANVDHFSPFAIFIPKDPPHLGAGNVKVKVYGRRLYVTGDDTDNFIRIEAGDAGPESFRVVGIGTTINGQSWQQFTGVRNGLVIRTGKGNDEVMLDGAAQGMQLKATSINTGLGNDVVRVIGVTALGNFVAVTGLGDDRVEVVGSTFNRGVGLLTGYGADYVNVERTTFDRGMTVNTGRQDDYIAFRESVFGTVAKPGRFSVLGSYGLDTIDAGLLITPNFRDNEHPERLKTSGIEQSIT